MIGFSDTAFTYLEAADLREPVEVPELTAQGSRSYAAAFNQLRHRLDRDIAALDAQGCSVHNPAVFFLTDGLPNEREDWRTARDQIIDQRGVPRILSFGIGDAEAGIVAELATEPAFAFVAEQGVDTGAAISAFVAALGQSVINSGRALADGQARLHIEQPQGFRSAAEAVKDRPASPDAYQNPGAAAAQLNSAQRPSTTPESPPTTAKSRGRVWAVALIGIIAVVALGYVVRYFLYDSSDNEPANALPSSETATRATSLSPSHESPTYTTAYTPPLPPQSPPPLPDRFVSIAMAPTGQWGSAKNYSTMDAAHAQAVAECSKRASGCKVLASTENGCAAVAEGDGLQYYGNFGATQAEAESGALAKVANGHIVVSLCTG